MEFHFINNMITLSYGYDMYILSHYIVPIFNINILYRYITRLVGTIKWRVFQTVHRKGGSH